MSKTILITGATDGIGRLTAELLLKQGHKVLVHGRSEQKLSACKEEFSEFSSQIKLFKADLSDLIQVKKLAAEITAQYSKLDVLINNAGVLKTTNTITDYGIDVRFVVNTIAPYLLTQGLLPIMDSSCRVINLSSAAQAPVDIDALSGSKQIQDDMSAYAQSKLAITMWTTYLAEQNTEDAPLFVSVNPGSLLASKMVKQGFGIEGNDLNIGANILVKAALSDEFAQANGEYFDNDSGQFASPHPDGIDKNKRKNVSETVAQVLERLV